MAAPMASPLTAVIRRARLLPVSCSASTPKNPKHSPQQQVPRPSTAPLPMALMAAAVPLLLAALPPPDALAVGGELGILEGTTVTLLHPAIMGGLFAYTLWAIVAGFGVDAAFHDPGSIDPDRGSGTAAVRRDSSLGRDPVRGCRRHGQVPTRPPLRRGLLEAQLARARRAPRRHGALALEWARPPRQGRGGGGSRARARGAPPGRRPPRHREGAPPPEEALQVPRGPARVRGTRARRGGRVADGATGVRAGHEAGDQRPVVGVVRGAPLGEGAGRLGDERWRREAARAAAGGELGVDQGEGGEDAESARRVLEAVSLLPRGPQGLPQISQLISISRGLCCTHFIDPGSSTQTKVDRDPRSNSPYQRCVPRTDPCSLACRTSFPDPVPRSERSGSLATMLWAGYLGWQWRRVRTVQDEIVELKKQVKPAAVVVGAGDTAAPPAPKSPTEIKIDELTEESKKLVKGSYKDRHFNAGSILLGLGVTESVGGALNTYLRTGKLFPGPHLFAGAAITVLWAAATALVPAMQKGNETARSLHIALNTINVLLFIWQIPTGLEIVGKVFEFTKWP